jgi:hypothetical protein
MLRTFLSAAALFTVAFLTLGDRARPGAATASFVTMPLIAPPEGYSIQLIVRDPRPESPSTPKLGCGAPCLTPHLPAELRGR